MDNPSLVTWEDVTWLDNLSKQYPYFQTCKTLIARHYLRENHLLKTHKIHSASTSAVDRVRLKAVLYEHKKFIPKVVTTAEKIEVENNPTETISTATDKPNEDIPVENETVETQTPESTVTATHTEETQISIVPEPAKITVTETIEQNTTEEQTPPVDHKEQERNNLLNAIQERLNELKENRINLPSEVDSPTLEEVKVESKESEKTEPKEDKPEDVKEETKEDGTKEKKQSTEKIKEETVESPPVKPKKTKIKKKVKEDESLLLKQKLTNDIKPKDIFYSRLGNVLHSDSNENIDLLMNYLNDQKKNRLQSKPEKETPSTTEDIVSQFIKTDPRISKPSRTKSSEIVDITETKSTQNKKLISENLAKINAKQGNIKEAIEIYDALILKYPEKKTYFATQIKKLK